MRTEPLSVAFFVSGEGSTLNAVAQRLEKEAVGVRIALVVCDRPGAPALERARERGLRGVLLPIDPADRAGWARRVSEELEAAGVELVVLAGFLSILPPEFVARWEGRTINLHPSLLPLHGGPGLYGRRVHEAVIASGARESGASVHAVVEEVDRGPVLAQVRLDLRPGETAATLRSRLHPHEVMLLFEVLRRLASGELPLPIPTGRVRPGSGDPAAPATGAPSGGAG